MSPIYKLCSKHKALYQGRCPACSKADNQRRARKQQAAGRTTAHWQKLKRLAKQAAGYRCQTCGRAEEPTPAGWLDVHLRDEYRHLSHAQVTSTEQVAVTCKFCHGSHHAPEAARTRGGRVASKKAKAPLAPRQLAAKETALSSWAELLGLPVTEEEAQLQGFHEPDGRRDAPADRASVTFPSGRLREPGGT